MESRPIAHDPTTGITAEQAHMAAALQSLYWSEKARFEGQLSTANALPSAMFEQDRTLDQPSENIEDHGTRKVNVWFKLAGILIAERIAPRAFILAQFAFLAPGSKAPYVNALLSPTAMELYRRSLVRIRREVAYAFTCQRGVAERAVADLKEGPSHYPSALAWELVIDNEDLELTALFRYGLACLLLKTDPRFRTQVNRWFTAAAVEYVRYPEAYDAGWGDFLSLEFRRGAEAEYRRFFSRKEA